jgi:hypothetical protein
MTYLVSRADRDFQAQVETCALPPAEFNHRAHVRLAYIYLADNDTDNAHRLMSEALRRFIACHGVDPSKFHETMTRAWIMAVRHFMQRTPSAESADSFIDQNAKLLDPRIMLTHYSRDVLFSDEARGQFVEPDLDPIPRHGS